MHVSPNTLRPPFNHEHTCARGSSFSTSCIITLNVPRDAKSASRFTKNDDLLKLQDNHGIKKDQSSDI